MNSSRIQTTEDFCKNHSMRGDREPCRIIPSKLSKKDLEDQYYNLLESNMALKKLVNSQQDQAKLLSAKVLRLNAAMRTQGRGSDCCVGARAAIEEQKQCIADLKLSNEKMAEKMKFLNMRLCSAKQFTKKVYQPSRCLKCSQASLTKVSSSVIAINAKTSDVNIQTSLVSSKYYDNVDQMSLKSIKTIDEHKHNVSREIQSRCQDNRCDSVIEALKNEITELKEELNNIHQKHKDEIIALEREVTRMQVENNQLKAEHTRTRAERNSFEEREREKDVLSRNLGIRLREVEANYNDVTMQLSLEKKKFQELEIQLKSAQMSGELTRTIEEHLNNEVQKRNLSPVKTKVIKCCSCSKIPISSGIKPSMDVKISQIDASKESKISDDSGFADPNRSVEKSDGLIIDKINDDLIQRIASLQSQLDGLKLSTAKQLEMKKHSSLQRRSQSTDSILIENHEDKSNNINISQNSIEYASPKSSSTNIYLRPTSENFDKAVEKAPKSTPKLKAIVREKIMKNKVIEKNISTNNETENNLNTKLSPSLKGSPKKVSEIFENTYVKSGSPKKTKTIEKSEAPAGPRTYSVLAPAEPRPTCASPDSTQYDISSISESSGREKSQKLSVGERRMSDFSESYTVTSSESEPLSEGEWPGGRNLLSIGEKPVNFKVLSPFANPREPIAKKMESTLEAITTELSRCTRLLNSHQVKSSQKA